MRHNIAMTLMAALAIGTNATPVVGNLTDGCGMKIERGGNTLHSTQATSRVNLDYTGMKPIYELPEGGEYHIYSRTADIYYYNFDYIESGQDIGAAGEVVMYDNGDVYMRNMIPSMTSGSYLKGKKIGNKILMEFPQILCPEEPYYDENGKYVDDGFWPVFRLVTEDLGYGEMDAYPDEQSQAIFFNINEDGSITSDEGIIGVCTQGGIWYGEAAWNYVYTPVELHKTVMPAGLELETWMVLTQANAYTMQIGFDGNDVYLKGIYNAMPDAVVKGTLEGDILSIPSPQYMGIDPYEYHLAYFAGTTQVGNRLQIADNYQFEYDKANGTMTGLSEYLMINAGDTRVNYITYLYGPQLIRQKANPVYGKVQAPSYVEVSDMEYDEFMGCDAWYIVASIPSVDVKGNMLDQSRMFYNFYFDDEKFYFDTQDYQLVEDSPDVPYLYSDAWNIFANGFIHQVYFFMEGVNKIAIQSFFEDKDYNLYSSDRVVYGAAAIPSIAEDEALSINYYDITGRRVARPSTGVYIREVVGADGERVSKKVLMK